jgi:hypothetical protein
MQPRSARVLFAFTLSTAMIFRGAATAADLPKEGTYGGTYVAYGATKATPVGKERILMTFDENGLSLGKGIADRMTWHCFGLIEVVNGMGRNHGHCVGTDPEGDQTTMDYVSEKFTLGATASVKVSVTLTGGVGKYAGISGGHTFVAESRPAADGTFFSYGTFQGNYKLP